MSKLAEVYPIGRVKYAPGTLASLIALAFGYYILIFLNIKFFLLFVFIFVKRAQDIPPKKDLPAGGLVNWNGLLHLYLYIILQNVF